MKIDSLTKTVGYLGLVRERRDEQSSQSEFSGQQKQQQQQEKDEEPSESQNPSQEKVDEAIVAFQSDQQAKANGLNASIEGNGPGLKVILKDGAGSIVRRFSGDEFLQMQKDFRPDSKRRGKILDQKL